jgi:hypothetical protein
MPTLFDGGGSSNGARGHVYEFWLTYTCSQHFSTESSSQTSEAPDLLIPASGAPSTLQGSDIKPNRKSIPKFRYLVTIVLAAETITKAK